MQMVSSQMRLQIKPAESCQQKLDDLLSSRYSHYLRFASVAYFVSRKQLNTHIWRECTLSDVLHAVNPYLVAIFTGGCTTADDKFFPP
jgi:hypothetical protein